MADFNFFLNRQGARGRRGEKGDQGYSPSITIKQDTPTEFIMTVHNEFDEFDTPNLIPTAFQDKITELDELTQEHTQQIADNKKEIDTLIKINDAHTSDLEDLGDRVNANKANIDKVSSQVDKNTQNISEWNSKFAVLNKTVTDLSDVTRDNSVDIDDLQTEMKKKQNKLVQGENITLSDNPDGTVTISSKGGGSGELPDNVALTDKYNNFTSFQAIGVEHESHTALELRQDSDSNGYADAGTLYMSITPTTIAFNGGYSSIYEPEIKVQGDKPLNLRATSVKIGANKVLTTNSIKAGENITVTPDEDTGTVTISASGGGDVDLSNVIKTNESTQTIASTDVSTYGQTSLTIGNQRNSSILRLYGSKNNTLAISCGTANNITSQGEIDLTINAYTSNRNIILKTNGYAQNLLKAQLGDGGKLDDILHTGNLVAGDGITISDPDSSGVRTISSTGGGGSTPENAVTTDTAQTITGKKTISNNGQSDMLTFEYTGSAYKPKAYIGMGSVNLGSSIKIGTNYESNYGGDYLNVGKFGNTGGAQLHTTNSECVLSMGEYAGFGSITHNKNNSQFTIKPYSGGSLIVGKDELKYKKIDNTEVDLLAGGGGSSADNLVTTDTEQEITAAKTFKSPTDDNYALKINGDSITRTVYGSDYRILSFKDSYLKLDTDNYKVFDFTQGKFSFYSGSYGSGEIARIQEGSLTLWTGYDSDREQVASIQSGTLSLGSGSDLTRRGKTVLFGDNATPSLQMTGTSGGQFIKLTADGEITAQDRMSEQQTYLGLKGKKLELRETSSTYSSNVGASIDLSSDTTARLKLGTNKIGASYLQEDRGLQLTGNINQSTGVVRGIISADGGIEIYPDNNINGKALKINSDGITYGGIDLLSAACIQTDEANKVQVAMPATGTWTAAPFDGFACAVMRNPKSLKIYTANFTQGAPDHGLTGAVIPVYKGDRVYVQYTDNIPDETYNKITFIPLRKELISG